MRIKIMLLGVWVVLMSGCVAHDNAKEMAVAMVNTGAKYDAYIDKVDEQYQKELALLNQLMNASSTQSTQAINQQVSLSNTLATQYYQKATLQVELDYWQARKLLSEQYDAFDITLKQKLKERFAEMEAEIFKFEEAATDAREKSKANPQDLVLKSDYAEAAAKYLSRYAEYRDKREKVMDDADATGEAFLNEYVKKLDTSKTTYLKSIKDTFNGRDKTVAPATSGVTSKEYKGLTQHFALIKAYIEATEEASGAFKDYFYVNGFGKDSLFSDALTEFGKGTVSGVFKPEDVKTDIEDVKNQGKDLVKDLSGDLKTRLSGIEEGAKSAFDNTKLNFMQATTQKVFEIVDGAFKKVGLTGAN